MTQELLLNEPRIQPKSRARLVFHEGDDIAPPREYSNRETWMATLWLRDLAQSGIAAWRSFGELPEAQPDAIRRWFHHRWSEVKNNRATRETAAKLAGIGSLHQVNWEEVASHYRRCPWFDAIQETFGAAREAGLPIDKSRETTLRRREAMSRFVGRELRSCREMTDAEWSRAALAIERGELRW